MQKDLIQLMHNPTIKYVSGGHLSTVLKVEDYVQTIRGFLLKKFLNIAYMPDQHIRCIKFLKDVTILVLVAVQMQGLAQ